MSAVGISFRLLLCPKDLTRKKKQKTKNNDVEEENVFSWLKVSEAQFMAN